MIGTYDLELVISKTIAFDSTLITIYEEVFIWIICKPNNVCTGNLEYIMELKW
jgi:hypothetical protein